MQTLIEASGVRCTDTKSAHGCTAGNPDAGDVYDVALSPDCGDDGFFASVAQDTRPACPPSRSWRRGLPRPSDRLHTFVLHAG
ncbi:hypothetical protein [Xanthomonas graminis]|uniref:hypothetical protein n=1 Tax=Xanthomonas graminis TaxID=3390026 RepID=UPI000AEA048C|nr:hypothetical protein [Xanthomonas translucens]UKE77392.1 hypothetical protein KM317_18610 [Xanthomonas translucens pv. arrhenatheri]